MATRSHNHSDWLNVSPTSLGGATTTTKRRGKADSTCRTAMVLFSKSYAKLAMQCCYLTMHRDDRDTRLSSLQCQHNADSVWRATRRGGNADCTCHTHTHTQKRFSKLLSQMSGCSQTSCGPARAHFARPSCGACHDATIFFLAIELALSQAGLPCCP